MAYYLGIDGGGTKTTCAIGDDSSLLATVTAGPSNIVRVGEEQARESLTQSVRQACAAAGVAPDQIVSTCVGDAGAARPELAAKVRSFLTEVLSTPIHVVGDMEIALEAAFDAGPGVIVIAGTGSIAYGRNRQGTTARAGGWGFAIGDEGSAYWIGRSAVCGVLRAADENPENMAQDSSLADLLTIWGVTSLIDLARIANSVPPPDFAALFPAVVSSGHAGAAQILTRAGIELARVAALVIRRLFPEDDADPVSVATTGGVFRHSALVCESFYNETRRLAPRARLVPQLIEPVEGALRFARRAAKPRPE